MDWLKIRSKFENFWYYYKWHTIGAIFILLTILVGTYSCSQKEDPDFQLLYVRDDTPLAEQADALQVWLNGMIEDTNGDGETVAKVISVARSNMWNGDDSQAMVVNVATGDALLYLVSEQTYNLLHEQETPVLQDLSFLGESPYLEGDRYNLRASGVLDEMNYEEIYPFKMEKEKEPLYLCLRCVKGTALEGSEKHLKQEELSIELLKKIISAENQKAES